MYRLDKMRDRLIEALFLLYLNGGSKLGYRNGDTERKSDKVIVSCAVGGIYPPLLERQIISCSEICPEYDHLVWSSSIHDDFQTTPIGYPPGSKRNIDSRYGFKVYAIREAIRRGYKKVIWFDSAVHPIGPIDGILEKCDANGAGIYIPLQHGSLHLHSLRSQMAYFGYTYEEIDHNWSIAAGTVYGFDFNNPIAMEVFEEFEKAEHSGMFGTTLNDRDHHINNEGIQGFRGTRHDETCMAFIIYSRNLPICNAGIEENTLAFDTPFLAWSKQPLFCDKVYAK